jgi:hypothetical protein
MGYNTLIQTRRAGTARRSKPYYNNNIADFECVVIASRDTTWQPKTNDMEQL